MAASLSQQSKGVFAQLSNVAGGAGVKVVIENHDAWLHNAETYAEVSAAVRLQAQHAARNQATAARLEKQRQALAALAIKLPVRQASAG